jgi:predicted PurR-regulated permease PerM
MQLEAYVISPRIMNKAVAIPGAVVVVAALSGGALLGVLGALVAIPVAASGILVIRQILVPHQDAK